METNISQKFPKYYCEICDIKTDNKKDYNNHILTQKHQRQSGVNKMETNFPKISQHVYFTCDNCNKEYRSRVGLWKHKNTKKCENISEIKNHANDLEEPTEKQLIMMLINQNSTLVKENNDFKNMILEVLKNGTHNTTNTTTHTNSHNKAFNLNFFLNETCKNAMNINDFVESIQLQVSDLINVGEVGFVEGISNIIVKNLDKLDVTQRPVHCTDKKREVVYIKDDDKWEKEDEQKKRLRKAIKKVVNKNEKLLFKYKEKYPDCLEADSRRSDQYNKIIIEAMGGRGDNETEKEDKIIRNITKKVTIDKEMDSVIA
jgi:hypothetical protein